MKQEHKEHRKEQISIIVDKAKDTVNNVVKKGKHKDE